MIFYTLHHLFHALFDNRWSETQINCLTALVGAIVYFLTYGYLTDYATGFSKLFKDWWWYIALVDMAVMAVLYRSYYGRSIITEVFEDAEDDKWDYDQKNHRYSPKEKPQPIQKQINNYYTDSQSKDNNAAIPDPYATQPVPMPTIIPDPNSTQPVPMPTAHVTSPPEFSDSDVQAEIDASLEHFQPRQQEGVIGYIIDDSDKNDPAFIAAQQQAVSVLCQAQKQAQKQTQKQTQKQRNDLNKVGSLLQAEFSKLDHDPTESEAMRIIENNIDKVVDDDSTIDQSEIEV